MSSGFGTLSFRRQAGISLIEVMITLTILAVVALALADGLVTSMRVTSVNEERAAVMRAAREKLEWMEGNKILLIHSVPAPPTTDSPLTPSLHNKIPPYFQICDTASPINDKDYGVIQGLVTSTAGAVTTNSVLGAPFTGAPFDVYYSQKGTAPTANDPKLSGLYTTQAIAAANGALEGEKPGEIVVMFDEAITAPRADGTFAYGRDLTGGPIKAGCLFGTPDAKPDGTTFVPPGDLDMDDIVAGAPNWDMRWHAFDQNAKTHGRLPVGVIIRWAGASGREERYELWTVLTFFQQSYSTVDDPPPEALRYD